MMQHDAFIVDGRIAFLAFKWVILRLDLIGGILWILQFPFQVNCNNLTGLLGAEIKIGKLQFGMGIKMIKGADIGLGMKGEKILFDWC